MVLKAMTAHPKLIIFGIAIAMTMAVATMGGVQIQNADGYHVLVPDGH